MEGALGERLKREFGLAPDDLIAWAYLVQTEKGRDALSFLWSEYIATAKRHGLPLAAATPTRRANVDRVARARYGEGVIRDNADFLNGIRRASGIEMYVGGLMGCKGDAYRATEVLSADEAYGFHAWQAERLAAAGVDFLYAAIMPALTEACGMAKALGATGLPYVISFMIRADGRLIDGTAIHDAITAIDGQTGGGPLGYMTNCVHPSVLYRALQTDVNRTRIVQQRFCGIQANTSPLPPESLDASSDLVGADCRALACDIGTLREFIDLKIVGGCCGTDNTHMEEIAKLLAGGTPG